MATELAEVLEGCHMMIDLFRVTFLDFRPVHDLPQRAQVRGPTVLVVQVVRVLPDVEGEEGAERFLDFALRASLEMTNRVVGTRAL